MLIQHRSIELRKALCLVPKNNFPTLSTLSVLGMSRAGVCTYFSVSVHWFTVNIKITRCCPDIFCLNYIGGFFLYLSKGKTKSNGFSCKTDELKLFLHKCRPQWYYIWTFNLFSKYFSVSYPSMDPCLATQIRAVESFSFSLSICTQ